MSRKRLPPARNEKVLKDVFNKLSQANHLSADERSLLTLPYVKAGNVVVALYRACGYQDATHLGTLLGVPGKNVRGAEEKYVMPPMQLLDRIWERLEFSADQIAIIETYFGIHKLLAVHSPSGTLIDPADSIMRILQGRPDPLPPVPIAADRPAPIPFRNR